MSKEKMKFVEAESVTDDNEGVLSKIVGEGSEFKNASGDAVRYLRNDGQPTKFVVDKQRFVHWVDESGDKQVVQVVIRNREGVENIKEKMNEENALADQLRLTGGEKAILYYYKTGHIEKNIMGLNQTFTVTNWPHLLSVEFGDGVGVLVNKRRYRIKVGETVKVTNQRDFEMLWKMYGFLNEVDAEGEVIRENVYTKQLKEPVKKVEGEWPKSFGKMDERAVDAVSATKGYKPHDLQQDTENPDASEVVAEEKTDPSNEI